MTLHPLTGEVLSEEEELYIGAATHYVTAPERMERAITSIEPSWRSGWPSWSAAASC